MDDQLLFEDFHATYDIELRAGSFERMRATLIDIESSSKARRWLGPRTARIGIRFLTAIVLVAFAIASAGAFVAINHYIHKSVPVHPGPAAAPCGDSSVGPFPPTAGGTDGTLPLPPAPVLMPNATTAWAGGGLRTTDGGFHWADVSPPASRQGMDPSAIANGLYPPGFADFYLDANHAWEIRTYRSSAACEDHFVTFATSDGGHTWQQSKATTLAVPSGYAIAGGQDPLLSNPSIQLYFADTRNGWVWVPMGPPSHTMGGGAEAIEGDLYRTTDGGSDWRIVSHIKSSSFGITAQSCKSFVDGRGALGTVRFLSPQTGWLSITCQQPIVLVTHDGGSTWALADLPAAALLPPVFFDPRTGVLQTDVSGRDLLFTTSDGGASWQAVASPVGHAALSTTYLLSAHEFWMVATVYPTNVSWVFHTIDGGKTWMQVSSDLGIVEGNAIVFSDSLHGLILGLVFTPPLQPKGSSYSPPATPISESYILLSTSDGGRTWQKIVPQVRRAS